MNNFTKKYINNKFNSDIQIIILKILVNLIMIDYIINFK